MTMPHLIGESLGEQKTKRNGERERIDAYGLNRLQHQVAHAPRTATTRSHFPPNQRRFAVTGVR